MDNFNKKIKMHVGDGGDLEVPEEQIIIELK